MKAISVFGFHTNPCVGVCSGHVMNQIIPILVWLYPSTRHTIHFSDYSRLPAATQLQLSCSISALTRLAAAGGGVPYFKLLNKRLSYSWFSKMGKLKSPILGWYIGCLPFLPRNILCQVPEMAEKLMNLWCNFPAIYLAVVEYLLKDVV